VTEAELNLGYTQVTAPISGRIGRNLVDVGNLVGGNEATLLATIAKYDPMYAYFNLNERDLLRLMSKHGEIGGTQGNKQDVVLNLALANETGYPHEGRLGFADVGVDPATGTILLRGTFANPPPYALIPGLFVRIRLPIATHDNALLVSERALGSDQSGRYLLVVNSENIVEKRLVTVGAALDTMRVIKSDLQPDDWVVIDGIQKARPGAKVDPQRAKAAPATDAPKTS
jgi:membrane fusion protein (multidrug efflux system)